VVIAKEITMTNLKDQRAVVTGGSRGIGLGIVEALVARGANVTAIARSPGPLAEVHQRLGVATIAGDIADPALPGRVLGELRPTILVLNAGTTPAMGELADLSWDEFSRSWNTDVRAGLQWIQAALKLPLPRGSRVIVASSGAAVNGSPMSGGYAGAKRMLWLMAGYANQAGAPLGIHFQVLVPRQILGSTEHGRVAAQAYAARKGVSLETFLAGFGAPITPQQIGEHVATLLTDPRHEAGLAFGVKGDLGLHSLDA
jgi:NAD(P)-dependent dehydrogenase (short-subunit alcohol dehydrogenase family)